MQEILKQLNDKQRQAVLHKDGPLIVFAGAGSGKTRIITTRIAHLVFNGVHPANILAVTFTNKAANEMRERVLQLCPYAGGAHIATFHSACARWLREFAQELGFNSDYVIYDDHDSTSALKTVIKMLNPNVDLAIINHEMKHFIHWSKMHALLPSDLLRKADQFWDHIPTGGVEVYQRYQEYLAKCNAMDFDDLILNMLLLLKTNKDVRNILQARLRYVLVDEYQDTNQSQMDLLYFLTETHRNLCVVGDDDQSIYSWRGASPHNILDFKTHYPDAVEITMAENYRCTGIIVSAANQMIEHNVNRVAKSLHTENPQGDLITFHFDSDGEMEAWWVADSIRREQNQFDLNQVAIFYRINSQSRLIEDALRKYNIDYQIYGSIKFYERLEVKDIMAYLRLMVNELDDVSLQRMINVPLRGIGDKVLELLAQESMKRNLSMYATAKVLAEENIPRISSKLAEFCELMDALREKIKTTRLKNIIELIVSHTNYYDYIQKKFPDQYLDKIENIHELSSALTDFGRRFPDLGLSDWLQTVTIARDESELLKGGVSLMTLHMAKGLEFERVFIVGMEDGLLPHGNSMEDKNDIEEERRLFYVGITRAKKRLSLVAAEQRTIYNRTVENRPSRFLDEIPEKYLQRTEDDKLETLNTDKTTYEYYNEGQDLAHQIIIGTAVYHPTYGKGKISELDLRFGQHKAVVEFFDFGKRKVSINHLRLPQAHF